MREHEQIKKRMNNTIKVLEMKLAREKKDKIQIEKNLQDNENLMRTFTDHKLNLSDAFVKFGQLGESL